MRKLILSLFIIVASLCCAQNRLCRLHVVDDATGDALPCVHAVVNGSLLGVSNADTTPIQRRSPRRYDTTSPYGISVVTRANEG